MSGFITTRDLLLHSTEIIHEFGVRCYWRCVRRTFVGTFVHAGQVTFLECIEPLR
jgi:hypothetical protein